MPRAEWGVLIADDEPAARRGVRQLLAAFPEFAVVGECRNGAEVLATLDVLKPHVVFLDVQMPGIDGFEVIRRRTPERMPAVVFLTAYDQFAIRAFEAQALDYLVKPVAEARFAATMKRLTRQLRTAAPPWRDGPPAARDRLDRGGGQLRAVVDRRTQPPAARTDAPAGGARACARLCPRAPARPRSSRRRTRVGVDGRHLGGCARLRGADSCFPTPARDVHRGGAIAGAFMSAIRATSNAACGFAIRRAFAFSASSFCGSLNKAPSFIGSVAMLLILMAAPLSSR